MPKLKNPSSTFLAYAVFSQLYEPILSGSGKRTIWTWMEEVLTAIKSTNYMRS